MQEYKQIGDLYFTLDTDESFARFINEAYHNNKRIFVEFKEGWEDFSGYHGGNGLRHSFKVGRSTGDIKIPLVIYRRDSWGGGALLTCKDAVKTWGYK